MNENFNKDFEELMKALTAKYPTMNIHAVAALPEVRDGEVHVDYTANFIHGKNELIKTMLMVATLDLAGVNVNEMLKDKESLAN